MNHLKRHLSVANVLSCLALFMAVSGVAYAATLGKNAVKAKNIATGAVTSPKIKNGGVTAAKLANGAVIGSKLANGAVSSTKIANAAIRSAALGGGVVTEAKIKNGAISASKLGEGAVSSGKLAPSFLAQLIRNVNYVNAESATNSEGAKTATALCPTGKQVIGGGARVNGELEEIALTGSNPLVANGERTGWSAFGRELPDEPGAKKWSVEAFAVCAEL